ncbi:MAG: hypothetical protein V4649_19480 [Bacteroidota bacterium]
MNTQESSMNDYEKFSNMIKELAIPAFFSNPNAELNEPKHVVIGNDQQGTKVQFNFTVEGRYQSVTFV